MWVGGRGGGGVVREINQRMNKIMPQTNYD